MERQPVIKTRLNLPDHVVLSLLSGKVEEIEGHLKAVEGGALFGVPDQEKWWGVINHSLLVRRVAMGMVNLANQKHQDDPNWQRIDVELVGNAGLLEDFAKRYEKESPAGTTDHAKAGLKILEDEYIQFSGKDEVKRLLVTHLYGMTGYDQKPEGWEGKIIILADHYATRDIVSLEERFADFNRRQAIGETMPTQDDESKRVQEYCYQAQAEFLAEVGMTEEEWITYLKILPETPEESKLREILRRPSEKVPKTLQAVERLQRMQAKEKEAREKRKTVIFDFGGVIVEDPDPGMINHMVSLTGVDRVRLTLGLNQVAPLLQTGKINEAEACERLEQMLGIKITVVAPRPFLLLSFKSRRKQRP